MAEAGSIFLNYRREDSQMAAGRLHDHLAGVFGRERIFTDVDNIGPGQDFTKAIEAAVSNCRVLLAIIGRNWTNSLDEAGRRRLDNPHDWVRFEIEAALGRAEVLVIPILTDNAAMPHVMELPGELAQLSTRQAFKISAERFSRDVEDLIGYLQGVLKSAPPPHAPGPPAPEQLPRTPPPVPPEATPPVAVTGYPAVPDDLQWSGRVTGSLVVDQVAVAPGAWVKVGDPLFVLRSSAGLVTVWSTYIGQVENLAYRTGQQVAPGQPLLTLSVSGWLFRVNARMPFDTGVMLVSGPPSRLDATGTASRLLVLVDQTGSRPVPWNTTCLLFVPPGSHAFSAVYELRGTSVGTVKETVRIRRGRRIALAYEAPRVPGASGKLRS